MQEEIVSAAMILPEAPLYVVVAIFVAVTAMTTADIRDKGQLLPNLAVNAMTLTMLMGSWLAVLPIIFSTLGGNEFHALSFWATVGIIVHSLTLVLLLVVVSIWYWAVAIHKETPAGMPTNPAKSP